MIAGGMSLKFERVYRAFGRAHFRRLIGKRARGGNGGRDLTCEVCTFPCQDSERLSDR